MIQNMKIHPVTDKQEKDYRTSLRDHRSSPEYSHDHIPPKVRKFSRQSAQGMVEFALTLPLILLIIIGIIEGGRLMFIYSSLSAAGREAARYGAGIGNLGSGTIMYNDCTGIRDAAKRIGQFAGVTDADIHIFHDSGPGTTMTEYCNPTNTTAFAKGDRISIRINLPYNAIVQLIPLPPLTLHTDNAHTILEGAEVVAVDPPVIPGTGLYCDVQYYQVASQTNPLGPVDVVTISNTNPDTKIVNVMLIWDGTGGPVLQSISGITPGPGTGFSAINSSGPYISKAVDWTFPTGTSTFTVTFSKVLKTNMIIRLTLEGEHQCAFGK